MKIKPAISVLLMSAMPLAAQADPATERALQLSEPLSAKTPGVQVSSPPTDVLSDIVADGSSDAMVKARLNIRAQQQGATNITVSENASQLAYSATR